MKKGKSGENPPPSQKFDETALTSGLPLLTAMSRFGGRAQDDDPEQIVSTTFVPKPGAPEFCFEPSRKQSDLGCFKIDLPRFPLPTLDALHRYLAGAYGYEVRVFGKAVHDGKYHIRTDEELHRQLNLSLPQELFPANFLVVRREEAEARQEPTTPGPVLAAPAPPPATDPVRTRATDAASAAARKILGVQAGATAADVRRAFRERMKTATHEPDREKIVATLQAAFDRLLLPPIPPRTPEEHAPDAVDADNCSVISDSDSVVSSKVKAAM